MKDLDKLQQRLIQLSVAIEDKTKTIDILIESINAQTESSLKRVESENARYRIELNNRTKENNQAITQILQRYELSTKSKESISADVERVNAIMKQENDKTKSCLLKVRENIKENIDEAAAEWNSCKEERRELWMTKKIDHVRECTVHALQPEIQRLSDSHELELSRLAEEASIRKQYLEREISLGFQRDFNKYLDETNQRKAILVERRIKLWKSRIEEEEERHREKLHALKLDRAHCTKDEKAAQENDVANVDYAALMKEVNDNADNQYKDIENLNQAKQNEIMKKVETFINKKREEANATKKQWYNDQETTLQKQFKDEMSVLQEDVFNKRDKDIEALIRHYHRAEVEVESHSHEEENEEVLLNTTSGLRDKVEYIKQQNSSKAGMIATVAQEVERLNTRKQTLSENIETKEKYLTNITSLIDERKSQMEEMEEPTNKLKTHDMERLIDLETHLSHLREQKQSLQTKLAKMRSTHDSEIADLSKQNTKKLKQMETQFLDCMAEKDNVMKVTLNEINSIKIKLQKKRNILLSIFTPKQQKKNTFKRKSNPKK